MVEVGLLEHDKKRTKPYIFLLLGKPLLDMIVLDKNSFYHCRIDKFLQAFQRPEASYLFTYMQYFSDDLVD